MNITAIWNSKAINKRIINKEFNNKNSDYVWEREAGWEKEKCAGGDSRVTTLIFEWILSIMECFIPHKKYQLKPNSQLWFMPEYTAAMIHLNHYYHLY